LAESLHERHDAELNNLDRARNAQAEFQEEVDKRRMEFAEQWARMKLERCRLGHEAAEIKRAVMAGDEKLVYSFDICNRKMHLQQLEKLIFLNQQLSSTNQKF